MEYEQKPVAEIKSSRVISMLGGKWGRTIVLTSLALLLAACATPEEKSSISVEAVMDVCSRDECFTATVPAELSATVNGEEIKIPSPDGTGSITLGSVGSVQVTARWGTVVKELDILTSDGSAQTVTIKFDETARVSE